jgi:CheY-like chemotaxis protein
LPKRKHILLADDEAAFRSSAVLALRIAGYRITEAEDGMDALDGLVRCKDERH